MARQHLGQHFLADSAWRDQIARAMRVSQPSEMTATAATTDGNFCWIEIGPGHGEMTEYLAGSGAPVHAIELDPLLIGGLNRIKKRFANLEVVHGDILESDLRAVSKGRRIKIYGSLPYYITSPILHHLFGFAELIDEIHVVVQTEVAERLAAQPGSKCYGYLSVVTQFYARPEVVLEIPSAAFHPPPEVGSSLVAMSLPGAGIKLQLQSSTRLVDTLSRQTADDEAAFLAFVKLCFAKKRKTVVNNLRPIWQPEDVRQALATLDLRPDVRAEHISLGNLAALYTRLQATGNPVTDSRSQQRETRC